MSPIELKNIYKIYPSGTEKVTALSDISLSINAGEFIAITGPSGCGKSTLLHMIGGLLPPTTGNIYIEGKSLYDQSKSQLALYRRTEVGIVYQFYNLVPELTAEENLILPALMRKKAIEPTQVAKILHILGMEDRKTYWKSLVESSQTSAGRRANGQSGLCKTRRNIRTLPLLKFRRKNDNSSSHP